MSRRYRRKFKLFEKVAIHGIADKGAVVGRDPEGNVVFARGAAPGDVVDVVAQKKKGVFQNGVIQKFHAFAEKRQVPFCEHFSVCGGCSFQYMQYESQLEAKAQLVQDAYDRIGKLGIKLNPILEAPNDRGYRNKMEYAYSDRRWLTEEEMALGHEVDKPALGFHVRGAWNKVLDVDNCHLQIDKGNHLRNTLRQIGLDQGLSFFNEGQNSGFLRKSMLRVLESGEIMLVLMFGEHAPDKAVKYVGALLEKCDYITSLYTVVNTKANDSMHGLSPDLVYGNPLVYEQFGDLKFGIGPLSFFQTNTKQAVRLYDLIAEYAGLNGEQIVYDLYAGVGSIGLYLAKNAKKIVAIEEIESAVEDAKQNASLNQIENFVGYAGDVKNILSKDFAKSHGRPDVVVTDPPRAGMHQEVVDMLIKLATPKLVYVSCNPATQARDLRLLVDGGYQIDQAIPVDMFPQTPHCEAIATLTWRG